MTKSELAEHLSRLHKLPKSQARLLLDAVFDCLLQALSRDERIEIRGFGISKPDTIVPARGAIHVQARTCR